MLEEKWPVLGRHGRAAEWLRIWMDLGRASRTIDAYARGLAEYLEMCEREDVDRHLCLTDLARMGWELHTIATFAGHRHTGSTLQYIHLSGRDLADKLSRGMEHIHAWRIAMLTGIGTSAVTAPAGASR